MSEREPRPQNFEQHSVRQQLDAFNIPYAEWGKDESKSLAALEQEIATGDATLVVEQDELLRQVEVLAANVIYQDPVGKWWQLVEDRQEFSDGRIRRRDLDTTLGEKVRQNENLDTAPIRAIEEELSQFVEPQAVDFNKTTVEERESPSFPGLQSRYRKHYFTVTFTDDEVRLDDAGIPRGYMEKQEDKTTYFEWRQVEKNE